MAIRPHYEDEVYEASRTGSVESLNRLIEKDLNILWRISLQTGKIGTPLHVSALHGHTEFTKALCINNPKLAEGVDADRRTPLHLAFAKGHKETVDALLSVYAGACSDFDENGRIPLHYAAMRGEVEVLQKLIDENPGSIYAIVENRSKETVLHLCIIHNQLECLKLLVEGDGNGEFLNSRAGCDGGVTILHLALMSTAALQERSFSRGLEIQQILMDAGLNRRENNENGNPNSAVAAAAAAVVVSPNTRRVKKKKKLHKQVAPSEKGSKPARRLLTKLMKWLRYPHDWVKETRGLLMVVATVISTMTFQAVANPPGGVWERNDKNTSVNNITVCSEESVCRVGTAVLGYGNDLEDSFRVFIAYNTITFLASMSVTLLLISGFPLHNRLCTWLLSMSMCVTLAFLALTYLIVLHMMVPNYRYCFVSTSLYRIFFYLWIALLVIGGALQTIQFLMWVKKRLRPMYFRSTSGLKNMITTGSFSRKDPSRFEENDAPVVV
ncbi:unnamed protein product [Malus baccata var. baccata]